jgi:hypothetical protein
MIKMLIKMYCRQVVVGAVAVAGVGGGGGGDVVAAAAVDTGEDDYCCCCCCCYCEGDCCKSCCSACQLVAKVWSYSHFWKWNALFRCVLVVPAKREKNKPLYVTAVKVTVSVAEVQHIWVISAPDFKITHLHTSQILVTLRTFKCYEIISLMW